MKTLHTVSERTAPDAGGQGAPRAVVTDPRPPELEQVVAELLARPAAQQPVWPDAGEAHRVRSILADAPALTTPDEVERLRTGLAAAAHGQAFVLQGGDCAETFADNTFAHVQANIRTLLHMSTILTYGTGFPVVQIGRIAGQYGKPRSDVADAAGLPVYRGDMINELTPTLEARTPDPSRMLQAYAHARFAMSLVRELACSGTVSLRHIHDRHRELVRSGKVTARPGTLALEIDRALRFMSACGVGDTDLPGADIFTSHEALLLDYEVAMLRSGTAAGRQSLYNLSSHFLWVGERTRQLDGAHVRLAELIANPIGIKLGPTATPDLVAEYVERFDPQRSPGRLTLITRMGSKHLRDVLPPIVERVTGSGHHVVWQCDPMHGNTYKSAVGYKTRSFDDIVSEVAAFFDVHQALGTYPGGLHVEFAGEDVTECVGGAQGIRDDDLRTHYATACDPRLNTGQAVELSLLVAGLIRDFHEVRTATAPATAPVTAPAMDAPSPAEAILCTFPTGRLR